MKDKVVGAPPKQTVLETGWFIIVGDAVTLTVAIELVTAHPIAVCETIQ